MKCENCYAENPAWQPVCSACGEAVIPVELCPMGHLLSPGSRECAVCPSLWPQVAAYAGPALLRGVFLAESGHVLDAGTRFPLPFLELRDAESPITLARRGGKSQLLAQKGDDDRDAVAKILVRPDGVQICRAPEPKRGARPAAPAYEAVPAAGSVELAGVRLRLLLFDIPAWAEQKVAR